MTALLYYCHCGQQQRCRVEAEAGERRPQLETEANHYYMITVVQRQLFVSLTVYLL